MKNFLFAFGFMVFTLGAVALGFRWFGPCGALCEHSFWESSPSFEEVTDHVNFTTNIQATNQSGMSALHLAAIYGDGRTVRFLLERGASVHSQTDSGVSVFELVFPSFSDVWPSSYWPENEAREIEVVDVLLQAGADPNTVSQRGQAILVSAAFKGAPETVALLIEAGADVNTGVGRWSALSASMAREDMEIAQILIDAGAAVDQPGLLYYAVSNGSEMALRFILEAGADPRLDNERGHATGLHGFARSVGSVRDGDAAMLEALLDAGADFSALDSDGHSPLFQAVSNGDAEVVRLMIEAGADATFPNENAGEALISALRRNRYALERLGRTHDTADVLDLLLSAGGNPNLVGNHGRSILYHAAREGDVESVRRLLEANAAIDTPDSEGTTPLLIAAREGHLAVVQALVEAGANIEAAGFLGRGLLFYSASSESPGLMEFVLSLGLETDARDDEGATPLILAAATGPPALIHLLVSAGADINATDDYGQTPLHFAARYADGDIVRSVLSFGADPNVVDELGRMPWRMGYNNRALRGDPEAYEMLLE